jgi:hypothetical protein
MLNPEDAAGQRIDEALDLAGWVVHDAKFVNIHATRGVATSASSRFGCCAPSLLPGRPILLIGACEHAVVLAF